MEVHIAYTLFIVLLGLMMNLSHHKARKRYIIFVSIVLIVISGLRNTYLNNDTFNYYSKFIEYGSRSFSEMWQLDKDPFFYIFTKFIKLFIGDNFQIYLILCSAILIIPLGRLIYKESENPMLSYLMFISLGFFPFSMVCIRQSMAIGILLLSYDALKQRKLLTFFLFVLLASAFHITALLFLIIYPLSRIKYDFSIMAIYAIAIAMSIWAGATILNNINLSLITERFDSYLYEDARVLSASGLIQLLLFAGFFAMYHGKMLKSIHEETNTHCHLLSLAIFLQGFVFVIAEFFRLSWYFKAFILVLIPLVISYSGKMRKTYTMLFTLLFMAYFFYNVGNSDYAFFWQRYIPTW